MNLSLSRLLSRRRPPARRRSPLADFLDRLENRLAPSFGETGLLSPLAAPGCDPIAAVSAGPRLASVDTAQSALLNGLLTNLAGPGAGLSLTAIDYNALSLADLNLGTLLGELQTELGVGTPAEALTADATLGQILSAAVAAAQAEGDIATATILNNALTVLGPLTGTIQLADLLQVDLPAGSLAQAEVNALDLLTGAVQLFNFENVATTTAPVTVSGAALGLPGVLNSVTLQAQVVEPPVIVVGEAGTQFFSAAIRTKLNLDLVDLTLDTSALLAPIQALLPGATLDVDASIGQLQVYADVARGSGVIQSVDAITNAVTLQATPSIADVYVGQIADAVFFNRTHAINAATDLTPGTVGNLTINATVLGTPLPGFPLTNGITLRAFAEADAATPTTVTFTPPYPETQTIGSSTTAIGNLVTDLITNLEVGLSGSLGVLAPLLGTITSTLDGVAGQVLQPVLTTVLGGVADPLLDALGVGIGEMDLTVLGADSPDPAVAADDSVISLQNRPVTASVLANDLIPTNCPRTLAIASGPTNGTAVVNPDGTITYTPNAGFLGEDSFTYSLTDQFGRVTTATVTVMVGLAPEPNQSPTVNPDTAATTAGVPVTIPVLANDTDPDGNPLAIVGVSDPANGIVVVNPDGSITYTPNVGFQGTDTFTYAAGDGLGGIGSATVTVTVGPVTPPNGNPVARPDLVTVPQDTGVTIPVLANDTDPDGDPLAVVSLGQPENGSVVLNPDGSVTYTPNPGFFGQDRFTYTASDDRGGVGGATVTVTVQRNNMGPVVNADVAATPIGQPVVVPVLVNDTDANGDPLSIVGVTQPPNGAVTVNPDGTITYTPNAGFRGTDTFTYTASDGFGGTGTATVAVAVGVGAGNHGPVVNPDVANVLSGQPVVIPVLTNDTDADGDPLTIAGVTQPPNGTVVVNPDGTITYTPNPGFVGTDTFTYTATDGFGGTGSATVTVAVGPGGDGNQSPTVRPDAASTPLGVTVFIPVLANDTDPNGDPLTIAGVTQPANGTVAVNPNGTISYTPAAGFRGTDTFTYTATDGRGGLGTTTVTVSVGLGTGSGDGGDGPGGNGSPVVNGDSAVTEPGNPVTIPVLANDTDPNGDPLTIAGVTQPANGTVTINPDGTVTYTPNPGFVGTDRFAYSATDGRGGTGAAEIQVAVGRGGRGPVLFELKQYAVGADTSGGPRVTVYNPDGSVRFDFFAYDPNTRFGANVVLGDLNGDGVAEVITSPGFGGAPHVRVLDGKTLAPISEFFAFDSNFRGGCTLAVGDLNGDGVPDLAVAAGKSGGPRVFVIDGTKLTQVGSGGLISPSALLADYFAFDATFGGGVSIAISDRDGDGVGELVTGAGPGGPPLVRVWDLPSLSMLSEFLAFDPSFSAGVNVGARGEFMVFGAGQGADPIVRVFRAGTNELIAEQLAYEPTFRGGVRVAFGETVDPTRPLFLAGAGPTGGPRIKVQRPNLEVVLPDYFAFEDTFRGGVFVA